MPKGLNPLLGPELLSTLRAMGRGDEIAIVDANYPAEAHAKCCLRADGHPATLMLDAILSVPPLDRHVAAAAFRPAPPDRPAHEVHEDFEAILKQHEPDLTLVPLKGDASYDRVKAAYAIVATGERRLYGNIIIRKGVIEADAGPPRGSTRTSAEGQETEKVLL